MKATLIVISNSVQLSSLEELLGESRLRDHDLNSPRKSEIIRHQSIWMRDWSVSADPPDSPLSQILAWYSSMRKQLLALDPLVTVKLSVTISIAETFAIPTELASQLSALQVFVIVSFKDSPKSLA